MLQKSIPKVTKLPVIGWQAKEKPFLKLLVKLRQGVSVRIVTGSMEGAEEVKERLDAEFVGGKFKLLEGDFTQFIVSRVAKEFLST